MGGNKVEFLGGFAYDAVTNALMQPTAAIPVLEAAVFPLTSVALYTGPRPLYITHLMATFSDIVVTDPAADRYLGWSIQSASDGSATPTYAAVTGAAYTANADLPLIHDNSVSTTAIQAVANVPVNLFNYVNVAGQAARPSPDVTYATQAAQPALSRLPVRIAANRLFQVRVGTYVAGALAAVVGVDNMFVLVYGYRV